MSAQPTIPHPGVLDFEELKRLTGFERPADVRRTLEGAGIRVFLGRDGKVWTTLVLVNAAGGIVPSGASNEPLDPAGFR